MNANIVEAHLELHRQIMDVIRAKVPAKKTFSFGNVYTLQDVVVDCDGTLKAEYSRYEGCGSYDYETEFLSVHELFKEQA